ncbi:2-oxoglutarate-dependent dioxygenase htyE-like isoform X2 [Patiria miniata]|uniref:Fe2OG dioxygenase domain-containing protein n=1 Tax=Patiria miniata TaxID=46514 RepID=A0A913ZQ47_PATMI|nr:2-oxoglutarate-dependent dioxygenase htyE-like isoform X2 [Patiria miniata]XP_038053833.1 2-oxoglutarate-dependent dioxygenase htyE-like isoform X2 [Patiria miniata]XP_038053834.1 2-oxoglutarate-dependent dioxygenase htyE-like isoform X2 [Patiria miniata]
MGDSSSEIPVVDFSAYRLSLEKPDASQFQKLVDDVHNALTTIGFFFIVNTDFPQEKVEEMYRVSKAFFDLPLEVKQKYPRIPGKGSHGYVHLERENTNPKRPFGDLKEAFNFNPMAANDVWPTETECPGFKATFNQLFDLCLPIHNRVLEVLAHGLKLEDPLFFVKQHSKPRTNSMMTLRSLFYPSLNDVAVKDQQVRLGEHSDFGGITLLFQQRKGLQVCKRDGTYVSVPMIEGAILVNIGDTLQRWTADVYIAAKHCVRLDETPEERQLSRQSIAFFGHPDNDAVIECIDKSNKYPPITCLDYTNLKFSEIY